MAPAPSGCWEKLLVDGKAFGDWQTFCGMKKLLDEGGRVPAQKQDNASWRGRDGERRAFESVSSGTQETRQVARGGARRRAFRPHQPSEVWRAAALQSEIRIPGSFSKSSIWRRNPARARDRLPASSGRPASLTCAADSAALRQQGYLTPSAACAGKERVPCGHLGRRPKATWRREQIQGLRAASAQNADICEVPAAKPPAK